MTTNFLKITQQLFFCLLIVVTYISCEGDVGDVGSGIVDNGVFNTQKVDFEVIAYNENIQRRKANRLSEYLLGVYKNDEFGQIEGTILSQLGFENSISFGKDPSIDTVIVNIPYHSIQQNVLNDNGSKKFVLDSIYGDQTVPFTLEVFKLDTYLNVLDPSDPTKELDYFTDDTYDISTLLYAGEFTPSAVDTVLYVKRSEIINESTNAVDIDTIKNINAIPSIKIALDEDYFTNNFFSNPDAFTSNSAFVEFFNGLYLKASVATNPESSIISLNMVNSAMTIYYTNTVTDPETGNEVREKQQAVFTFGGVTNSIYTRDYTGANAEPIINNPNTTSGDERLYLHGAAGSVGILELFPEEDIEEIRSKNFLINNANIVFYIDQNTDTSIAPYRVFLYNYDTGQQLPDILFEGLQAYGGKIAYDASGNPEKYKINITDYISRVLSAKDPIDLSKLAIKVLNSSDLPTDITDVEVGDYSWTPKGTVLHGNKTSDTDKRIKLEITYSIINQ